MIRKCERCGKPFNSKYSASKYCSKICSKLASKAKTLKTGASNNHKPPSETICWTCQNATGGCSWSRNLTPVDGWKAEIKKIKNTNRLGTTYTDSYKVISCPEYIEDEPKGR